MFTGIDHPAIACYDVQRQINWYCQNLGMRVIARGETAALVGYGEDVNGSAMIELMARKHDGPPPVEVPTPPPEVKFPNLTLAGIIESTGGRTAIINKRIVKQGEQVEGILVEAIRATEVVLRAPFGTKRLALSAFGETAPRP